MWIYLGATLMVVLAEMGDKTQLLAMAFATRFQAKDVLWGVLIATILNHALAVAVGAYLGSSFNFQLVQLIAAVSFILFGLWTIRGDTLNDEHKRKMWLGPIATVAIAFFIAEMGDKTQLATVAIAAKYDNPMATLLGTTTGMMIADALGIYVGVVAGKRIPERIVKWISAGIFILFGLISLYVAAPREYVTLTNCTVVLVLTGLAVWLIGRKNEYKAIP
jgi:putative Ca2+/H+ antiporter (TMEM165/GDT1 family)